MTNDLVLHPQIFCAHNKRKFQSNNDNQTNGSDRFQYRVIELDAQWSYHSQISVFIHYIMCITARLGEQGSAGWCPAVAIPVQCFTFDPIL